MNRVKILYIVGPTRSGSTLLARLLNEYSGVVSVGEVVSLDVALQSSRLQASDSAPATLASSAATGDAARRFSALCGCMRPLHDCPIWGRIEGSVFGHPPDYSPWSWDTVRPSVGRFILGGSRKWLERNTRALGELAESVYRELARLMESRVVVDESKTPLYGYFLRKQPWADVLPVRLVRDPRGTAASWYRQKPYPGIEGGHLPTHSSPRSSADWLKRMLLADQLFPDSPLVRYEDFITAPTEITSQLLGAAGVEGKGMRQFATNSPTFGVNHILAGNPDKFERGELHIRPALNWSEVLGTGARMVVTAATFPLLRRYGYAPWTKPRHCRGEDAAR
jgi:hypothetical protein